MCEENITLAPLIVVKHKTTMKLLKIFLIASMTLFFATNYAEAQNAFGGAASGGTYNDGTGTVSGKYSVIEMGLFYGGCLIGLIGFGMLTYKVKKDARTKNGYKDNADPWRVKSRLIGLALMVLGAGIAMLVALFSEPV